TLADRTATTVMGRHAAYRTPQLVASSRTLSAPGRHVSFRNETPWTVHSRRNPGAPTHHARGASGAQPRDHVSPRRSTPSPSRATSMMRVLIRQLFFSSLTPLVALLTVVAACARAIVPADVVSETPTTDASALDGPRDALPEISLDGPIDALVDVPADNGET